VCEWARVRARVTKELILGLRDKRPIKETVFINNSVLLKIRLRHNTRKINLTTQNKVETRTI